RGNAVFTPEGYRGAGGPTPIAPRVWALGNYFEALGIPLRMGRYLTALDRPGSERVALINETMARRYWPSQDPVGKRFKWGIPECSFPWIEIVGVVGDVKQGPLHAEVAPQAYQPYLQHLDFLGMTVWFRSLNLVVRAEGDPGKLAAAARNEV